jgi:hypothetical protein
MAFVAIVEDWAIRHLLHCRFHRSDTNHWSVALDDGPAFEEECSHPRDEIVLVSQHLGRVVVGIESTDEVQSRHSLE